MNKKKLFVVLFLSFYSISLALGQSHFSGEQGTIYIPQGPANRIAILDGSTFRLIKTLPGGSNPHGLGISPDGKYLYAPSLSSDKLSVINTSTGKIIKSISVGDMSHHVAVSPNGKYVYATISSTDTVSVIDTSTYQVIDAIPVGKNPDYPQFSPDGRYAYVTNMNSNSVSVIDTAAFDVIKSINVGKLPSHLAVSRDGKYIYVANLGSDSVSVIDAEKLRVTATIKVGKNPHGIDITPDGKKVFVANSGDATLSVIDTGNGTVINTVYVKNNPNHVTAALTGNIIYIGLSAAKKLLVINSLTYNIISETDVFAETHQIVLGSKKTDQLSRYLTSPKTLVRNSVKRDVNQNYNEKTLSRKNKEGRVMIDVTFMNPLLKETGQDLVFKIALNTHMGSLLDYEMEKLAIFKNSTGIQIKDGFRWVSDADAEHHRSGYLKMKQTTSSGISLVGEKVEYIILELNDIGGVPKQIFKWNKKFLTYQSSRNAPFNI